jgi:hypothetical protein
MGNNPRGSGPPLRSAAAVSSRTAGSIAKEHAANDPTPTHEWRPEGALHHSTRIGPGRRRQPPTIAAALSSLDELRPHEGHAGARACLFLTPHLTVCRRLCPGHSPLP